MKKHVLNRNLKFGDFVLQGGRVWTVTEPYTAGQYTIKVQEGFGWIPSDGARYLPNRGKSLVGLAG